MTIQTKPVFYYVGEVDSNNQLLNFVEPNIGPTELTATLSVGSRSMTDLITELQRALNDSGENTYTVTFNRNTRIVTIAADDTFELLVATGSNSGLSVFGLVGFTGADRTGASSYDGDTAMGDEYSPQFLPQKFKAFENNKEGILPSVNESADGVIEIITFGFRQFMEMNIIYITERQLSKGNSIENNQNALTEIRNFLDFSILRQDMEFMIDRDNRSSFDKVLLESTRTSRGGTSYELRELVGRGLEDFFETGNLKFRKIT